MKKVEKIYYIADDGIRFEPWSHRKQGWVYDGKLHVWTYELKDGLHAAMCLGERYVNSAYGRAYTPGFPIRWHGSEYGLFPGNDLYAAMNWHGGIQTPDFEAAVDWLHEARWQELEYHLWGLEDE